MSFILMSPHADLISQIHTAETSYLTAMDALKMRNEAFQTLHSKSALQQMDEAGHCVLRADRRDIKLLKDVTDALFESVDDACKKCEEAVSNIRQTGKNIFPRKRFLSFEQTNEASSVKKGPPK